MRPTTTTALGPIIARRHAIPRLPKKSKAGIDYRQSTVVQLLYFNVVFVSLASSRLLLASAT
jgi:hypothetical protein